MAAHPTRLAPLPTVPVAVAPVWRPHAAWPLVLTVILCGTGVRASLQPGSLEHRPARIVSLVPAVTEMLFAMGAGAQVVAVSSYGEFPAAVRNLPTVGALLDPDVERILSLRPDLVVVYGSQTDLQAQLARAGIRFFSYRHAGLSGIIDTMREVATAVGRPEEADRVARGIQSRLDRIRARVQGRPRPRAVLVFERDPSTLSGLYVSGGRGFLHDLLELAGGANVFADVARESAQPSHETLLARAPEVIIEIRATGLITGANADTVRVWARLASIPAVRDRRVHLLSGDHLVVAGPRVAEAADVLARVLHPGAFR